MIKLFQMMGRFVNNMDAKAWTSLFVSVFLLIFVLIMLVYGREWLGLDQGKLHDMMVQIADSRFALLGVISVFCLLALTGFPQTLLFAGAVAVFGPTEGAINSWIATMCSGTLTFAMGQTFGGRFVGALSAGRASRMISYIQERGIVSTMVIRWIPSAPFIVINAMAGAARISIFKFWLGTGLGIIPKIVFIAALGGQVDAIMEFFSSRDPKGLAVLAGIVVLWLVFLFIVQRVFKRLGLGNTSEEE